MLTIIAIELIVQTRVFGLERNLSEGSGFRSAMQRTRTLVASPALSSADVFWAGELPVAVAVGHDREPFVGAPLKY